MSTLQTFPLPGSVVLCTVVSVNQYSILGEVSFYNDVRSLCVLNIIIVRNDTNAEIFLRDKIFVKILGPRLNLDNDEYYVMGSVNM